MSGSMAWAGFVALVCKMRNICKILDGKLEGKRSVGRPRNTYKFWIGSLKVREQSEGLDLDGETILKRIFSK
jgi:hypothetical protein